MLDKHILRNISSNLFCYCVSYLFCCRNENAYIITRFYDIIPFILYNIADNLTEKRNSYCEKQFPRRCPRFSCEFNIPRWCGDGVSFFNKPKHSRPQYS